MALQTACTASCWPTTRRESDCSIPNSWRLWADWGRMRDISDETWMPVLSLTTWAMSRAVTAPRSPPRFF